MDEKKKKARSARKGILITLCVVLTLILGLLIAATVYLESMFSLINRTDEDSEQQFMTQEEYMEEEVDDPNYTVEEEETDEVDWGEAPETIGGGKDVINILLIGQDRREGEGRTRSDAMILCTINKKAKTLTMSSFMRDMYVQIPGYQANRINASYAFGGMELLDKTLNKNFGVVIDGNVEVDFSGFQEVIELLGGVEIELTADEASYLNRRGNWDLESNAGQWKLKAGINNLNGSQALAYSRIRNVGNGDFGRTNRQRTVLSTLIQKAGDMNALQVNRLLRKILPLLTTDMTDAEIMGYAFQVFTILPEMQINTQQIPAEGTYQMTMIRGMSVLRPDLKKNQQILSDIMAE